MTHPVNQEPFTPWYREPWVWAILGLLMTTFIWGSYRIYYAFKIQDSVVVDDYYKSGKAINQDLTRDQNARDLNIAARLYIDDLMGEVRVTLQGDAEEWPESLKLSLLSPTFADRDNIITLQRSISRDSGVVYVGQTDHNPSGKTYIQLETMDELIPEVGYETGWRLNQAHTLEPGATLKLQTHP
ncbi:FixH family protein [Endozoicomonas montiporae]|uniref:Cytochrome c oxidase accessory protein CcoH n=1 Tax=Endozoicomonas montiporae CL-33 TaxID=570277 RepID=A0A142BEX9_9GAMM|nr:FixH family protein [Endozoicomonas montiporae]AMO57305.1 cytochrome c oxidase accessory protein CcoH [Endozoicomonas montiporae CL-33]